MSRPKRDMVRINLDFERPTLELIDELKIKMRASSRSEVIRRAVDLLKEGVECGLYLDEGKGAFARIHII